MKVWLVTRTFHGPGIGDIAETISIWSSEEKARAVMAAEQNQDPWYGKLDVTEWPVDD